MTTIGLRFGLRANAGQFALLVALNAFLGAMVGLERTVLPLVDPDSGHTNPHLGGLDRQLILFCADGFSSSFAAASLRELGCRNATDVVGGFAAWKAAGLSVRPPEEGRHFDPHELPGMGPPEPLDIHGGGPSPASGERR